MCISRLPVSIPDAGSLSYMQAACRDCPLTNISDLLVAVSAVLSCCHGCSPSAQPQSFLSSYKTAEVDHDTERPLTCGLCRTMGVRHFNTQGPLSSGVNAFSLPDVRGPDLCGKIVPGCQFKEVLHPGQVLFIFFQLILEPLQPEALAEGESAVHGFPCSPSSFLHLAFPQQGDVLHGKCSTT